MKIYNFKKLVVATVLLLSCQWAWAQSSTTWDGTDYSTTGTKFAENKFADEGLAVDGHDGKSWDKAYVITTARQLAYFAWIVKNNKTGRANAYYWKLGADINLGGHNWTVFGGNAGGAFQGHFDGQNHTISNVTLNVTTNSNYGLFTTIQGVNSTTQLAEVKDLNITGVTFTSDASRGGNTRVGALAGYVKMANITNVNVSNVTFTYTAKGAVSGTNQLGGAIGCIENNTTLDDVDVTGLTASFAATTNGLYVGGIVGASTSTANTNSMTHCDVKSVKVTHTSNITGTTYIGGLVGNSNTSLNVINNNTVDGQETVNDGKGFDVSVSGTTVNFYAGGLLGYTIGDGHEVKNNSVKKVYITNTGTINGGRLGGFIGYVESNGTDGKILVKGNTAHTVNILVGGNTAGTPYLGGFIGQAKGKASPNNRSTIEGNTVTSPSVTMNGVVGHGFYMGGFLGYADVQTNLYNNKVETPALSITEAINAETYVGGAVGRQNGYTTIDGMTVTNGSITGPTSVNKNVNNNVAFFVGGFIGQQNSSGTAAYQTNKFMNVAVSGMTINLGKYVPGGVINNHKFAVGGIAGSINTPNKDTNGVVGMPENIIFKGGKIYAPYAATSPTVANFNASVAAHNNYTGDNVTTLDALDLRKTKTWYYTDYQLGLSAELLKASDNVIIGKDDDPAKAKFRLNCDATFNGTIQYITVNSNTFKKQNRYMDNERQSWTVLWWTNQGSHSATGGAAQLFTKEEQPIYPQSGFSTVGTAELVKFPWYMYFYQGVANATYVLGTDAANIVAGIEANISQAAQTQPVELTIVNANEKKRGFDARTITVSATQNKADVTGTYTYKWYVDGVAKSETGSSISVTPHWKYAQGVTVIAMSGATKVATATYTLPVGVLKTKSGDTDLVGMSINERGTKANPYIIDCDYALRQLSLLSTLGTGYRWEGLVMPTATQNTGGVANQSQGHYNRAYYELSNDITMASETFVPISHMGYNSNGSDGTYTDKFVFQGNFDGKGHKISGLKITWGAGQYNGNDANVYHGLFGAVGHSSVTAKWGDGTTTSNTVVQNLVIENATLTHDTNNTTFSYKKSYGYFPTNANENNCMVGVLAGIVAANTTIQNIEIRGSKITDDGTTSNYSLATKGLFVGGAIGSVQAAYNSTNIPTNTVIKNIVVGTDITLTKALIDADVIAQQGAYNVGGIIGRFASTNGNFAATQAVMPKYLLYTGSIKAWSNKEGKRDALISPVIAATRYSSNQSISLSYISKIWEGNNNASEQLTVTDALYYNFKISNASGEMTLVTDAYPSRICKNGARAQDTHTDGSETAAGYNAQRYQGVNYNAIYCDATTYNDDADGGKRMAVAILNSHDDVDVYWEWSSGDSTPHMTSVRTAGAYLEPAANDAYKVTLIGASGEKYYKWYVGDAVVADNNTSIHTQHADISNVTIKAEVYDDAECTNLIATTQYIVVKGEFNITPSIVKTPGDAETGDTYTVGLTRGGVNLVNTPDSRLTINYQWYKGNNVNTTTAQSIGGAVNSSLTIKKSELGDVNNLFCHFEIMKGSEKLQDGNVSIYVREANVVYLQFNDVTTKIPDPANPGQLIDKTYSKTNAGTNSGNNDTYGVKQVTYSSAEKGKSPDSPVNSWAEAYALLNPYTEPTETFINEYNTQHSTSYTTSKYDFSALYNDGQGDYPYDVYKRDDKKRKVKPIENCTNSWDNNVIVLMGLSTDGYFNTGETNQHAVDGARANKPVTITGQWNGTNYYGYLSNLSGDFSINADHKFENMGLGVLDKGIGATESIRYRIYAHRWNVHAGKGLLMGWAAALEWGPSVVPVTDANKKIYKITNADVSTGTPVGKYACDIAIMGGYLNDNTSKNPEMFEYINHGRDDIGQQIKIESGFWGPVCPGNRQTDSGNTINTYYTMGGPDHPAKTTITVDIDREWNDGVNRNYYNSAMSPATVDIGCMLTGNHEGTMYADVTLDIRSGNMGRIVNGIKGAQRRQINNPASFTTGGHYRHIVKYSTGWQEIAAPAPDSYFGRGILNFDPSISENNAGAGNAGVNVVELYCGGLGRGHNDGSYHPEVRSYFYGLCEVNIKGGTFQKTIYGSGAGGTNGIGTATNHTDDDGLPYWNTDLDVADTNGDKHVWYAPYDYIKKDHSYKFVTVKVAKNNSEDKNLTTNGEVDLEKTRNIINISGGIFGSEAKPVSIYAGGNGETDAALINPSSEKVGDVKNTYNTPNHQAGNMYGAADGLTTEINISGDATIYGSIFGGGKGTLRYYRYFLRAPADKVAYEAPNQGYTHIMNPGDDTYNKQGGDDWKNIINTRLNADNYLKLGQVYGNTKVSITGDVKIYGNVYGGGEGVKDITITELFRESDSEFGLSDQSSSIETIKTYSGKAGNNLRTEHIEWDKTYVNFPEMGKIYGEASVEISGNVVIHGNVYGGGKAGAIDGKSYVDVKGSVNVYGNVYGAGQGLLKDEAKDYTEVATIKGDATVTLSEDANIWQDVFGGGENAVVNGDTHLNMSGGHIAANVYGGGKGKTNRDTNGDLVITSADVYGNTNVNITGGTIIWDRTSVPTPISSSVTKYTYTKTTGGESGSETYTTRDENITVTDVEIDFKEAGYTNVSVGGRTSSGTGDDIVYSFVVSYNKPKVTETEEVLSTSTGRIAELLAAGYIRTSERTEENNLAEGTIVRWDTDKASDYRDTDNNIFNDKFYDDSTSRFLIEHNIFGGGYEACRVGKYDTEGNLTTLRDKPTGTATVSVARGLFSTDLIGTKQWKLAYNDNQNPHFYVFGGGYGALTSVGATKVEVGVNEDITNASGESDEQWAKPSLPGSDNFLGAKSAGENHQMGIADNSYGEPGYTILGVLGGGYAGIVTGNTDVHVGGNTFMHRIYGGGYGQLAAYNKLKSTDKIYKVGESEYDRESLGMVMGNTNVKTDGGFIQGDVFGGGAGVESAWLDGTTYKELDDTHTTAVKDFAMGEVKGTTSVEIGGRTFVLRSVYGGGDVAQVRGDNVGAGEYTTTVNIISGTVINDVYGGGSGRLVTGVTDVSSNPTTALPVGAVIGETLVTIDNTYDPINNEILSQPSIYGDIYGGGAYGKIIKNTSETSGNTNIKVNGGKIGGNIFGGGLGKVDGSNITSADIAGNTNVTVNGGSYLWDVVVDENGNEMSWENIVDANGNEVNYKDVIINQPIAVALTNPVEYVQKAQNLFSPTELVFKNKATDKYTDHNIYGGGNTACISGAAYVTINHSMFDDDLGYFADMPTCTPGGLLRFLVHDNKQHPQFSVLGGGYGANTTVASTDVTLQVGKEGVDGYDNSADNDIYDAFMQKLQDDFDALGEDKQNELYGGTSGPNVQNRYITSRLAWSYGIPNHSVLTVAGGGMAGKVTGNSNVTITDRAEAVTVFGGGIGLEPKAGEPITGGETYGQVGGNAIVSVTGGVISGNIYGGGAGIESVKVAGGVVLSKDDANYSTAGYVDFVDMARVLGTTSVTISGSTPETLVYGAVYGGGDVANVGIETVDVTDPSKPRGPRDASTPNGNGIYPADYNPQTTVTISGGCVFGEIFGGGSGRTIDMCSAAGTDDASGYKKVGAVYGNSRVILDEPAGATNATKPWIWSRIYGGGSYGKIYGNTDVQIRGGNVGYNIYGGGVGKVDTQLTKADVTGNTNIYVTGGEYCLSQMWNTTTRAWYPSNKKDGKEYSAQYDPVTTKFNISHNIYGGSYNCGNVIGDTYINMQKGLVSGTTALGHDYDTSNSNALFAQGEWKEIYEKTGSPHFSVFGAGYGENTSVANTHVNVNFTGAADIDGTEITNAVNDSKKGDEKTYTLFKSKQTVMDVIGGGYSGKVLGSTNVDIDGKTFMRNAFGGSFYAPVGQTNIVIKSVSADNIFGGGMMGDVKRLDGTSLAVAQCGTVNLRIGDSGDTNDTNDNIYINNNVFGGNDVSGEVTGLITASIFGGKIFNNVYGAGNGNYLYAINQDLSVVTTHEKYESNGQEYDLVYEVPWREDEMGVAVGTATDAVKIININSYRPTSRKVKLNLYGSSTKPLTISGNVFGGGNTATVNSTNNADVEINIGSNCKIGGIYMGDDGEAMFEESNGFMDKFQKINGVDLTKAIAWNGNPVEKNISETFLPVKKDDRQKIYPHVLDLYFQPVEMSLQPTLNWVSSIDNNGTASNSGTMENTTIGTFVCGGNRGNMNVSPVADGDNEGRIVNYTFPEGLTITNRIVGGCNNANYDKLGTIKHIGGYLLGKRNTENPAINLTVKCKFDLADGVKLLDDGGVIVKDAAGNPLEQRNVYGGCYQSGTIYGDVNIDFRSNMLTSANVGDGKTTDDIAKAYFGSEVAMGNIYGAGYGSESYVYGNTKVTIGEPTVAPASPAKGKAAPDPNQYVAMSVYGGGQQGNVIGNTTVRVLNGHIGKSVVGGSYAGYMWGSTQVLVGYPTYYKAKQGGIYTLARADKWNTDKENHDGSKAIKQEIYLLPNDIVSQEVYEAITTADKGSHFDLVENDKPANWDDVKITIDEACYGGGYSLASGSSVAAGTYTVKKYDDVMNITGDYDLETQLSQFVNHSGNSSTKGYGGNTTVLVWDNNDAESPTDHINISTQTMTEVSLKEGTDLFGYYYRKDDGKYGYIYQEGEYFYTTNSTLGAQPQYYTKVFESDSEGGMYGDGHLSFAEGFRAGELVGYGFAHSDPSGSKIINTFQRMDMLRIKDCAVTVLGARDYTVNEISKTPYSIARIGELQMMAENVVGAPTPGNLVSTTTLLATTESHSRNYLGLSNNIHYIGAVKSNVDFNSTYHYGYKEGSSKYGKVPSENKTYRQEKQNYVTANINDPATFQKRNDGTAANMIGISSGYAMKVLNVNTKGNASTEETFYGPIVGVVEMNLIDVREDEGGGYVYADNVHHRSASTVDYSSANYDQVPAAYDKEEDFLETSGNFVFPYDEKKNRYIVDDCFHKGFDVEGNATEATEEGHFWYVTGYNYYYNAHITGYTYNSKDNSLIFHSDKDALLTLTGAKKGQLVNLQSFKWRSNHIANKDGNGFLSCDLESTAGDTYKDITSTLDEGVDVSSYFEKNSEGEFVQSVGTAVADKHYYEKTPATYGYTQVSLEQDADLSGYYTSDGAGNYTSASGKYDAGAGISYYRFDHYKDVTDVLDKASDVSSYYTKSAGSYTKASGHYVDGTTYYLHIPEAYEDITSTLKSGDALTGYYTHETGYTLVESGTYNGTGTYYKLVPESYEDVTEKLKVASSVSYCYTASANTYTQVGTGYYAKDTQYYVQLGKGNTPVIEQGEKYFYDHYNLFVGTANSEGKYDGTGSYWTNLPLTDDLYSNADRMLTNTLSMDSPTLAFQLTDKVDNSGNDYFQKYMAQPCNATVVLTCPATEDDGVTQKWGYVPISYFFTRTGTAPNYTYTKMKDGDKLTAGKYYYYFGNGNDYHEVNSDNLYYYHKAQQRYVSVMGDAALAADKPATYYATSEEYNTAKHTSLTEDQFTALSEAAKLKTPAEKAHEAGPAITAADLISGSQEYTFYDYTARTFTYTIYLTIDYVQGPDVSGHLRVNNCALPGEKIKIDRGTIDIKSDVAMSQTAAIWKIFKPGTAEENKYVFDQANPYDDSKTAAENVTSPELKDVEYKEADNCIYVPAYYYMNGYKVEYCYRVNGIDQLFTVPSGDNDFLTIHNYHRMMPRAANGKDKVVAEFHLDLAAQRAAEDATFAEPRIYIADAMDLNEFPRFLMEKKITGYDSEKNPVYGEAGSKYDFGNHMQFHLLEDIRINDVGLENLQKDHYADEGDAKFKGTLNGNGYVISDLGVRKGEFTAPLYLFKQNEGNIYNLGLHHGFITKDDMDKRNSVTNNSLYHCLYTWDNKAVYRQNGNVIKYTDDDFRYGRVAYDLNEYYLVQRNALLDVSSGSSLAKLLGLRDAGLSYVESLYHNGDYLYSHWNKDSKEYLRSEANRYDANYNSSTSYHLFTFDPATFRISHEIDNERAVKDDEGVLDHYAPLFEETSVGNKDEDDKTTRNDYLFFGQLLKSATKTDALGTVNSTLPDHITNDKDHNADINSNQNRMYRAGGYYASEGAYTGDAFYHNAEAYIHDNGITAIDFFGYGSPAETFYAPVVDYGLLSVARANGVTRNLLTYAHAATDAQTSGVLVDNVYNAATTEANIKMHVITPKADQSCEVKAQTALLHLVERAAEDEPNNDFDAPFAFDVTDHAWYTRKPLYYAEADNTAWEGITLPFTAKKVTASLNGEITHFYGTPTAGMIADPATNDKTLHHEYWLRGLTSVSNADGETRATYQRPGEGMFYPREYSDPSVPSLYRIPNYEFSNTWFADTYNSHGYNGTANTWYNDAHTFTDYLPLTANIPYVVSFPGERYYEFDLSSRFYNKKMAPSQTPQTVEFSSVGATTIMATATSLQSVTANGYDSKATYLYKSDAAYGMNATGTAFVQTVHEVLPFRTYMETAAAPAKSGVIYISGDAEVIDSRAAVHGDPADGATVMTMKAYAIQHNIIIDSDFDADIIIYSASGQIVRAVHVLQGNNIYTGFGPGIYVINGKKLIVR